MKSRKATYRQRLFGYFAIVFIAFAVLVTFFQYKREKQFKTENLESTLDSYAQLIDNYITTKDIDPTEDFHQLDSLAKLISIEDIRITVIAFNGDILYDSFVSNYEIMDNHLYRPEVQEALMDEHGACIRFSNTTKKDYYYFARKFEGQFIRTAKPYTIQTESFLKADNLFLYFMIILFAIVIVSLIYISGNLGKSISRLKDFAYDAGHNRPIPSGLDFPNNELGDIGQQIVRIYDSLKNTRDALSLEREKLMRHLQVSQSGLAVFTPAKKEILSNSHFFHFLNLIADNTVEKSEDIFIIPELATLNHFVNRQFENTLQDKDFRQKKLSIAKNGRFFEIELVIFKDKSFEIAIHDVTKQEKARKVKKELTNNIAHELKTPVATVQGYLETLAINPDIQEDKRTFFLDRALKQSKRLGDLIDDISALSKIEEATHLYDTKSLAINKILDKVIQDVQFDLNENQINVECNFNEEVIITGNKSLIYSIFRNLIDNSIKYVGKECFIQIHLLKSDENHYHFSYSDDGPGVPEEHLNRLFERFYRVDKGRRRNLGGTGLGLAIVKNAVLFHGGEISVKNKTEGGLEFIFSLQRK